MGILVMAVTGLVGAAALSAAPVPDAVTSAGSATRITGWSNSAVNLEQGDRFSDRVTVSPHGAHREYRVKWRRGGGPWKVRQQGESSRKAVIRVRYSPPVAARYRAKIAVAADGSARRAVTPVKRFRVTAATSTTPTPTTNPTTSPSPTPDTGVTAYAVGDIGLCGGEAAATAALIPANAPVLALGDLAYPNGTAGDFANCYLPAYGRLLGTTYPVPGNHEYLTSGAGGYFAVFGARVGTSAVPWYAISIGDWTLYQLNSNCAEVGGCGTGSQQYRWLSDQLAAGDDRCIAASWHHPRWSAGSEHGPSTEVSHLYALLVSRGADVLMTGHEHSYQRFARLSANGTPTAKGMREFVIGTGGAGLYPMGSATPMPQVWNDRKHGVVRMNFTSRGYSWKFLSTDGAAVDSGSDTC